MIKIAVLGTLDNKGLEPNHVADCLRKEEVEPVMIDARAGGPVPIEPTILREEIVPELKLP